MRQCMETSDFRCAFAFDQLEDPRALVTAERKQEMVVQQTLTIPPCSMSQYVLLFEVGNLHRADDHSLSG